MFNNKNILMVRQIFSKYGLNIKEKKILYKSIDVFFIENVAITFNKNDFVPNFVVYFQLNFTTFVVKLKNLIRFINTFLL